MGRRQDYIKGIVPEVRVTEDLGKWTSAERILKDLFWRRMAQ